jgi:PAS domain S-box-containing protein
VDAQRFNGYEGAEILGEHFSRFYTEEDRGAGQPEKALATAAREGRFEGDGWRLRKDGTKFWASIIIDRISDPRGISSALLQSAAILPSGGQSRLRSGAARSSSGASCRA